MCKRVVTSKNCHSENTENKKLKITQGIMLQTCSEVAHSLEK